MKTRTTQIIQEETSMMIHIGAMTGRNFAIEANPTDTVLDVKLRIFQESNLPPESQILLFGEKQLSNDHSTLKQHCIEDGARLSLVLQMHGGHGPPIAKLKQADKEVMLLEKIFRGIDGDTAFKLLNLIEDKPDLLDSLFPDSSPSSSNTSSNSGSDEDHSATNSTNSASLSENVSRASSVNKVDNKNSKELNSNTFTTEKTKLNPQVSYQQQQLEQHVQKGTQNHDEIEEDIRVSNDMEAEQPIDKSNILGSWEMKRKGSAASLFRLLDSNNKLRMSTPNFRPNSTESITLSIHTRASSITSLELVNLLRKSESVQRIVSRASSGKHKKELNASSLQHLGTALNIAGEIVHRPGTSMALLRPENKIDVNDMALILPQSRPSTTKKSNIPVIQKKHHSQAAMPSSVSISLSNENGSSTSITDPNPNTANCCVSEASSRSSKITRPHPSGLSKDQQQQSSSLSLSARSPTIISPSKQSSKKSLTGSACTKKKTSSRKSSKSHIHYTPDNHLTHTSQNTPSQQHQQQKGAKNANNVMNTHTNNSNTNHQRCEQCKKKLGLATVFSCRCGKTLCSVHRYSDRHACNFNYKEAGRAQLIKDNPTVKKGKVNKI